MVARGWEFEMARAHTDSHLLRVPLTLTLSVGERGIGLRIK